MQCNLNPLTQYRNNQTSSGMAINNEIFDRESGQSILIQNPCFDLMISGSSLSFRTDSYRLSPDQLILLLKCLLIIQNLSESALEEASEALEAIAQFYSDRFPSINMSTISPHRIRGNLITTQVRPPLVLDS